MRKVASGCVSQGCHKDKRVMEKTTLELGPQSRASVLALPLLGVCVHGAGGTSGCWEDQLHTASRERLL